MDSWKLIQLWPFVGIGIQKAAILNDHVALHALACACGTLVDLIAGLAETNEDVET